MPFYEPRWRLTVELQHVDSPRRLCQFLPLDVAVFGPTNSKSVTTIRHDLDPGVSPTGMLGPFVDQIIRAADYAGQVYRLSRIEAERLATPLAPPNTWDASTRGQQEVEPA